MAFQFAHIQTYSRKGNKTNRSVAEICAEAGRVPGHHPHVAEALPPTLLAGDFWPEEIPEEIERRVKAAKELLRGKTKATKKIITIATHVLEAQVYSHPAYVKSAPDEHTGEDRPCLENEADREAYVAWRNATVEFVYREGERRGLEVLSIVEHLDEAHPHVHALLIPTNSQLNAKHSHPGHRAAKLAMTDAKELGIPAAEIKEAVKDPLPVARAGRKGGDSAKPLGRQAAGDKALKRKAVVLTEGKILQRIGNRAYSGAMRLWQDSYHEEVGIDAGLLRTGPKRFRWSREEYQQRQQDARVTAATRKAAKSAEERRTAAEEKVRQIEASIAPGSELHERLAQLGRDALARTDAAKAELAQLEPEVEAARETISAADEAANQVAQRRADEEELKKRIADLEARSSELRAKNADAEETFAQLVRAQNRLVEIEKKVSAAQRAEAQALAAACGIEPRLSKLAKDEEAIKVERGRLNEKLAEADRKLEEAEAKVAGLDAWIEGDLEVRGELLVAKLGKDELKDRLKPVRDWLHSTIKRVEHKIENTVAERVASAKSSMFAAVDAIVSSWASGALRSSSEGKLVIAGSEEEKETFKRVADRPWKGLVKAIFAKLPSFAAISQAEMDVERLQKMLTEAEERDATNTLAALRSQRSKNFGPDV